MKENQKYEKIEMYLPGKGDDYVHTTRLYRSTETGRRVLIKEVKHRERWVVCDCKNEAELIARLHTVVANPDDFCPFRLHLVKAG